MGLDRMGASGSVSLSRVTGANITQSFSFVPQHGCLPFPHLPCSTHLNGLGGLFRGVIHQRFLGLKTGRVSQRGRAPLPECTG